MKSICGVDCNKCEIKNTCKGCIETNGHPFGGNCVLASLCNSKQCNNCSKIIDEYKTKLISEFNALKIKDMPEVTQLYSLNGSFVNMEYKLPNGEVIKLLNNNDIYIGNQLQKLNSDRCYGLCADDNYLLVCEYGENGNNPEIIIYKRR